LNFITEVILMNRKEKIYSFTPKLIH
jgi:hypothetical protein